MSAAPKNASYVETSLVSQNGKKVLSNKELLMADVQEESQIMLALIMKIVTLGMPAEDRKLGLTQ